MMRVGKVSGRASRVIRAWLVASPVLVELRCAPVDFTFDSGGDAQIIAGDALASDSGISIDANEASALDAIGDGPSYRVVFVTENTYLPNFGGHVAADAICQHEAMVAGLPGTFMAWVSDSTSSPSARFVHSSVPYQMANGLAVANNWLELTSASIERTISVSAFGTTVAPGDVWTASNYNGTYYNGWNDCSDWTYMGQSDVGTVGSSNYSDSYWSLYSDIQCNNSARLYCFEQ